MTEAGKSPNPGDFPASLENAQNAFPTFPLPRRLDSFPYNQKQNQDQKQNHPKHRKELSSGRLFKAPFRLIFQLEKTVAGVRTSEGPSNR